MINTFNLSEYLFMTCIAGIIISFSLMYVAEHKYKKRNSDGSK